LNVEVITASKEIICECRIGVRESIDVVHWSYYLLRVKPHGGICDRANEPSSEDGLVAVFTLIERWVGTCGLGGESNAQVWSEDQILLKF